MIRYYRWCLVCKVRACRTRLDDICELCFADIINDFDGGR